jgi:hypothetical protein
VLRCQALAEKVGAKERGRVVAKIPARELVVGVDLRLEGEAVEVAPCPLGSYLQRVDLLLPLEAKDIGEDLLLEV